MTTASREVVRADTGEVVSTALVPFDMATYLSDVKGTRAIAQQQGLMAAYDAAVAGLIGPNDVQQDGNRTFKKKSAWRKLARHFNISVRCTLDDVRVERHAGGFTAIATATGEAPWGQSWTDVGSCGSDEATGRRTITEADAIATAMTRASNRAVSNLIAMGEVSAEEIGERGARNDGARGGGNKAAREKRMPFGKTKGKALGDMTLDELSGAREWCQQNSEGGKKFGDLIAALSEVIAEKSGQVVADALDLEEVNDDGSDLPF